MLYALYCSSPQESPFSFVPNFLMRKMMFPQSRHLIIIKKSKRWLKASPSVTCKPGKHPTVSWILLRFWKHTISLMKIFFFPVYALVLLILSFCLTSFTRESELIKIKKTTNKKQTEYLYSQHYFEIRVRLSPFYHWNTEEVRDKITWKMLKLVVSVKQGNWIFWVSA